MGHWMILAQEASETAGPVLGIFAQGQVAAFLTLVLFLGLVYAMITRARAGLPIPPIREIAGLEAIDEAIGRATEMGRPVHFIPGLQDPTYPQTIASFAVSAYVGKTAARYDTRLIYTNNDAYSYTIVEEILRQSYLEAGRPDAFNPDDVRVLSMGNYGQFSYTAAAFSLIERERPAAQILFGPFWAESIMLIEAGALAGAIQIGATANTHQLPFFVAACDYSLIGEEMYAASAYLSKEPVLTGTVVGQDWAKIAMFAVIVLGAIIAQFQGENNFLANLLSK